MIPDLENVIRLQSLDQRITELQKEISALPKHIDQIGRTLEQHVRRLDADRAALSANQKERKRLEGEIQAQEQKVSKLKGQTLEAKTNEQYRAFQNEIQFCQNEIRKFEDRILDLMSESEPLEANVKTAEGALKEEKQQVERESQRARERTAADRSELEKIDAERTVVFGALSTNLQRDYVRIRKKWGGLVAAEVTEGRCSACNLMLRPQLYQELRTIDTVMFCENCGRFLFYNPVILVDEHAGPKPVAHQKPATAGP